MDTEVVPFEQSATECVMSSRVGYKSNGDSATVWPLRSRDSNSADHLLRGYIKHQVYQPPVPLTLELRIKNLGGCFEV